MKTTKFCLFNNIKTTKNMKNFITLVFLSLVISLNVLAQETNASGPDISQFLRFGKTYVVLNGQTELKSVNYSKQIGDSLVKSEIKEVNEAVETEYNKAMRFAMKNFWKGKFEFITEDQFEEKKFDQNAFFILTAKIKKGDKDPIAYNYLILVKGGPKSKKVEKMPQIAAFPLAYEKVSEQNYIFKLPSIVQLLYKHAEFASQAEVLDEKKTAEYYNQKTKEIKNATLYILYEDATGKIPDEESVKKIYKGEVKFVTQSEIDEAIKKQDPNVVFFHKVSPEKTVDGGVVKKYIIAAKGGELLYIGEHKAKGDNEGLLESDLKLFNRTW
jgi:hypothetical protein